MIIEHQDELKSYLIVKLSELCSADPNALVKYLLALLKKNVQENELRKLLLDQLDVFLQKNTAPFVDLLLKTLKTKSYITNSTVSSTFSDVENQKKNGVSDLKKKESHSPDNLGNAAKNSDVPSSLNTKEQHERNRGKKPRDRISPPPTPKVSKDMCKFDKTAGLAVTPPKPFQPDHLKRCQDYDERGFCLKGNLCQYDHGCDPILVEDVSTINFNVCPEERDLPDESLHTSAVPHLLPPPPLPTISPPPLPPLPPQSMLDISLEGAFIPEPYNPESPGMGSYWPPPQSCMPVLPSSLSLSGPNRNVKPQRQRELIGVPTVNSVSTHELENKVTEQKRKFDFSRLGPPPKKAKTDCTLELRKVPAHLNSIAMLNSHFSTFGRIVNVEIAFSGDPESALVKFASPIEALNAYRSSVAIFNNRFIKVFYHRGQPKTPPPEKEDTSVCMNPLTVGKKENTGIESTKKKYAYTTHTPHARRGNVSRTVFIPPVLQKSSPADLKVKKEKQLELLRKKYEFLKSQIDHEKLMLDKLMKSKNKKEKEFLKKTIQTISSKICTLKTEIMKESEDIKKFFFSMTYAGKANINNNEKALLDAEMDFYKKKKSNTHSTSSASETNETAQLLSQVNKLKQKAESLGIFEASLPPHIGTTSRQVKLKKHSTHAVPRPRKVLVSEQDKDQHDLLNQFEQFGTEDFQDKSSEKVAPFSSRTEAEAATFSDGGSQLDDAALNLIWFQDRERYPVIVSTIQDTDPNTDTHHSESKPHPEIVGDDEEDEEDGEGARYWRH